MDRIGLRALKLSRGQYCGAGHKFDALSRERFIGWLLLLILSRLINIRCIRFLVGSSLRTFAPLPVSLFSRSGTSRFVSNHDLRNLFRYSISISI